MNPDLFRQLAALGLSTDQMAGVLEIMQADAETRNEKARARWRKWKEGQPANVSKRLSTSANVSKQLMRADAAPDLENKQTNKQENKIDASPSARGVRKAFRIPDDFVPDLNWAIAQGLSRAQAETQAATFRDFWTGAKDGSKADWPATWRNWVRKFIERNGISPRPEPKSDDETWRKRLVYARLKLRWGEEWGPMPGDPNCRAPPGLLEPGDGSGWGKWESTA